MVTTVCDGGFVRAFSYEGRDLWTYRLRGRFAPFILRGPDGITWVAKDEPGGPRSLIALNRAGRKITELNFDEPIARKPQTGLDGRVFVPFRSGVTVFSLGGQKLGDASPRLPPETKPEFPNIKLSLTRAEGRRNDGSLEWFLDIDGAAALPTYAPEGLLFIGGKNWLLAAYSVVSDTRSAVPDTRSAVSDARSAVSDTRSAVSDTRSAVSGTRPPAFYGLSLDTAVPDWVTLTVIEKAIDAGELGDDEPVFAAYLRSVAKPSSQKWMKPDETAESEQALWLLGRLGSAEYMPFLTDVFLRERDPRIRTAIVRAMGAIGIDRNGKALEALASYALPVMPLRQESLLGTILEVTAKLCVVNGPPAQRRGMALIGAYRAQKTYPRLQAYAMQLAD
jgi:hypothetical protein